MSHPHGASFENIDQQGPSSVESITADTSPHMALVIKSETSRHVAQENQNQTYKCETCKKPTRSEYLEIYRAALEGNWDRAKRVVEEYPEAIQDSITETRDVLHIAFASKHTSFVKEMVRFLTDEDLERINVNGDTALCFAAKLGTVKIAKEMVKKNNRLPMIRSSEERTPLHIAAKLGSRDMTSYLCDVTLFEGLSPDERIEILMATITNDMYDIALKILEKDVTLGTKKDKKTIAALCELAKKPFVIGGKSRLSLWERCFNFG
uniref:Uncharacterized protein n=1 Tax=Quercus lobata TaxID=97700 RepID=A0A7N2MYK8_QUELO